MVLVPAFHGEAIAASHPHCAAALREEVLSGLARFREIQLVADNRPEDEAAAARADRADRAYQLSATLLPEGEGVKVLARVKHLADGRIVWAETMSLADTGAARGVETIVRRMIGAAVPAVDEDIFESLPVESDDFYDRYLIAKRRSLIAKTYEEARAAADALEALIAERPDFGLAYPPLVRLYNIDFGYTGLGSTGPAERARALELAKAGLAADRRNVHAFTVLGFCHLWHDGRDQARACFEQALAMNPHNPVRLNEVASGMIFLDEFETARALLDLSVVLQSYPDDIYHQDRCLLHLLEGQPAEGLEAVRRMSKPSFWSSLYMSLCEAQIDLHAPSPSFLAWCSYFEKYWLGHSSPSAAEMEQWVAFHIPFLADRREPFMELVRRRLAAANDGRTGEARRRIHSPDR